MDNKKTIDMLKDEVMAKADPETISKLKNVKSPKEALARLEGLSIDIDDEMLSAVSGGEGLDDINAWCEKFCPDYTYCRGYTIL